MRDRGGALVSLGLAGLAVASGAWFAMEELASGGWFRGLMIMILVFLSLIAVLLNSGPR